MRDEGHTRAQTWEAGLALAGGSRHYRAYVGPPSQFDFMGATQFRLLTTLGLREHHSVLDFGCGSLRVGRLLIPGGDDFVGIGGPGEGPRLGIVLVEEAVDGGLEIDNLIWNRPCTKA